jgi:3-hydroxyisobutyrate dehydrogenase-like beta-hydroxyacid dehydrogenase
MGKVGFLGIGTMGSRMSARLLDAGHEVTVWNRSAEKTVPLRAKGAAVAATPAEAASGRDIVLANLTDAAALRSVIAGPGGVLEAVPLPPIFVDMATIAPGESAEVAGLLELRGIAFLRAPVSGTAGVVEAGKLTIMASGDRAAFDAAEPYLAAFSETRYYMGPGEQSRFIKLIHQMMIAGTMQIWAEGLAMGEKAGLDWDQMLDVLAGSAVGSGVVKSKIALLKARDYGHPAMSLHNIVKDLDLALRAGAEVDVELPATRRVRELYQPALDAGLEWKDYAAILLEIERRAGLEPKESSSRAPEGAA